ncbi:formylglycine-generating enzyme family protein [Pseudomonas sp. SA3-5]|uniref:Formylglycine-generating enzyme family protein n=1 Tax=Pseudomonas aestuarii TaxID=3018340 RepID=A0ABT4XD07_9PSED|nr:formylglycine-generating enzyme family protein [Pseudomonas aestuarii]MDA7086089.1 formylglycine-generating enzyme family protein [Pseudomonas aestuarii]
MNLTLKCAWAARALLFCCAGIAGSGWAADYRLLSGGEFRSVLPADGESSPASIQPFWLRSKPVSNAEYQGFLQAHPQWRRGRVPAVLAGTDYLASWAGPLAFAPLQASAPVTQVSWHAAQAFCASEQARLPTWYEWEFAAAADELRADARSDPLWLARILAWYSRPASQSPQAIGLQPANYYGIQDLHELMWEWVEDFNGLFVSADSRTQGEQKQLAFCGGAALSLSDKNNYAVLIRLSLLAAMEADQGGNYLGFRCAREPAPQLSGAPND